MPTVGEDLAQGDEDEAPAVQTRVRQDEMNLLGLDREHLVVVEQEIEINRAWALRDEALAAQPLLDRLTGAKHGHRIEGRAQEDHLIEEARLLSNIHRLGLIDGGASLQRPAAGKLLTRAGEMRRPIAEV